MTRYLLFVCLIITVLVTIKCNEQPGQKPTEKQAQKLSVKKKQVAKVSDSINTNIITIAAVGDLMLGTSYPNDKTLPPDSAKGSFKNVEKQLRAADITFGNLEGTLLDKGAPAYYKLHQVSKAWMFRMPVSYAAVLKDAGFNVLSLANNHMGDFGDPGRQSTIKVLDSLGIYHGGQLNRPYSVFNKKGIIYGFCAFAPNSNTLSIFDLKSARRLIRSLKRKCNIVIVSFHGGGEGVLYEHLLFKNESFNHEKRGNVYAFAHNAIDAGADLVLGNGPHVCRAMELYKGRLIAYSLGNFCTYRSVSVSGICGYAPLLTVQLNYKGHFLKGKIISAIQSHNGGLKLDTANRAAKLIRYLTTADFKQPGLVITNQGNINQGILETPIGQ